MSDAARIFAFSGLMLLAAQAGAAVPSRAPPVMACPSLANLRILVARGQNDPSAAAAILADPKADHLSCILLERDRVTSVADRVAFNGREYECLAIQGTTVCHWTIAGALPLPVSKPAAAATGVKR